MKKDQMSHFSVVACFWLLVLATGFAINGYAREEIGVYELKNGNLSITVTNYGARIISLLLPDKHGKLGDVLLGYDTVKEYLNDSTSFGATVGRVANRIAGAQFKLNGTLYKLIANDGKNTLHGGPKGFSKVIWNVKTYRKDSHIVLTYHSFNGEQGFPGDLRVTTAYRLLGDNRLSIIMTAKALNKATPVNLVNHAYFNLGGHNSGDILSEEIQIFASKYTPLDSQLIPTGKIVTVKGTPYDFLKPYTVGSRFKKLAAGYDINYELDGVSGKKLKKAAIVYDKKSGRRMEVLTNQPGVQFYTSNTLTQKGKGGFVYKPFAALCLETQGYPDAIIPAENIVAAFQGTQKTVFAISKTASEAQIYLEALEQGLGGVVLRVEDLEGVIALKEYFDKRSESGNLFSLTKATVTRVQISGMGDRVCVDLCSLIRPGEGLLVGCFARGLFLVHSECLESNYIASRPFRVNAGPVHAYASVPGGKTCYLSELKAGKEVVVVCQKGQQRTAIIGRVKIETRPLVHVEAKINSDDQTLFSIFLQNAETVALIPPCQENGLPKPAIPVTSLRVGDEILLRVQGAARHTGIEIQEFIVEN